MLGANASTTLAAPHHRSSSTIAPSPTARAARVLPTEQPAAARELGIVNRAGLRSTWRHGEHKRTLGAGRSPRCRGVCGTRRVVPHAWPGYPAMPWWRGDIGIVDDAPGGHVCRSRWHRQPSRDHGACVAERLFDAFHIDRRGGCWHARGVVCVDTTDIGLGRTTGTPARYRRPRAGKRRDPTKPGHSPEEPPTPCPAVSRVRPTDEPVRLPDVTDAPLTEPTGLAS